ncbi:hypothetical protein [Sinorhizobium fredii]|uniref:hypothetical protein n=1 Tax=Rhizobium fredii TaxID=380 RepID=UPI00351955E8
MSARLVELLTAEGVFQLELCRILEIDPKTLRKHYRAELDRGAAKLEAKLIGHLLRIASGTGATALKAITFCLCSRFGWSPYAPPPRRMS